MKKLVFSKLISKSDAQITKRFEVFPRVSIFNYKEDKKKFIRIRIEWFIYSLEYRKVNISKEYE